MTEIQNDAILEKSRKDLTASFRASTYYPLTQVRQAKFVTS